MNEKQNVLVIGSGGREHAIVWKLLQSANLSKLYAAPGNGGACGIAENVPIQVTDIMALAKFAEEHAIHLTVVGPEEPLALGIVDEFQRRGLRIWGPTKAEARIEGSKVWAKWVMEESGVPTSPFFGTGSYDMALRHVREHGAPVVIKADGPALGKGVYVCNTMAEAEDALDKIMVKRIHGSAGNKVVIEDLLVGREISIHAFCDGQTSVLFPPSQDHKPAFNGDKGSNTGGMGAFASVPWVSSQEMLVINETIVRPIKNSLVQLGSPFKGCLYPGLMMTKDGPKVLEFNCRGGDPEMQVYLPLLKTDLLEVFNACVDGRLADLKIEWHDGFAVCVVLASRGYPGKYEKGFPITGIKDAERVPGVVVFHAGTKMENGRLVTNGGRVLGVTAHRNTLKEAVEAAYKGVSLIKFPDMHFRTDIGAKALA